MASVIKINQNNVDKIVAINGQILQAPAGAGELAEYTINASKGTVSNHSINIVPSLVVTSAGNVNAGTENGTAVSVTASELVSGTKSITSNGTNIDVTNYAKIDVAVPTGSSVNVQNNKTYTVNASGNTTISPDSGYDAMSSVALTVPAQSFPSISTTASGVEVELIGKSTSTRYFNVPTGFCNTALSYEIEAVPNGTATPASTITGTGASVSSSSTTLTLSKTISNTPIVSAGYISNGTSGNSSISLSATDSNFTEANIKNGVTLFGKTGTYIEAGGGGYVEDVSPNNNSFIISNVTFSPTKIIGMCGYAASGTAIYGFKFFYSSSSLSGSYYYSNSRAAGSDSSVSYNASTQTLTITNTSQYSLSSGRYWTIFYLA